MHGLKAFYFLSIFSLFVVTCQPSGNTSRNTEKTEGLPIKKSDVEAGIRAYISKSADDNTGKFHIQTDSFDLELELVRVHTEYLAILDSNRFFACVDLATTDGDVYDVDFFLEGRAGDMQITRKEVHKLNGRPFYSWKQDEDKTWYTVPMEQADNELLGVLQGRDHFTFTYEAILPELKDSAVMWMPLVKSDRFQKVDVQTMELPARADTLTDPIYGNKALHLELTPDDSEQSIVLKYEIERLEKSAYREDNAEIDRYLQSTELLPVNERFKTLSAEIIAEKEAENPLSKARALYDYIIDNLRYAKQGTYGTADAAYACDAKSGNCTEFHSLFISLARSAGIPARFAVGAAIPSERNEGGINGYHCWAEFYAEGKWWPVDISEANKYSALATYYFGHHPANRVEFSKGRDIVFIPGPESGSMPFFAYPILEKKSGQEIPVRSEFSFQRILKENEQ